MHERSTALVRERTLGGLARPPGRRLPPAGRRHAPSRARPPRDVARAVLDGERGELASQLDRLPEPRARRAAATRSRAARARSPDALAATHGPRAARRARASANGLGGFTGDGREYVIALDGRRARRRCPWSNVLANPALRHARHGVGPGAHLVGEQPREPPHAVRERSRHRPHGRGVLPPRRGRPARAGARRRAPLRARRPATPRWIVRARARASPASRHGATASRTSSRSSSRASDPVKLSLLTLTNRSGPRRGA